MNYKQLRIGSHVSIGGKTRQIAAVDGLNGQIGIEAYKTDTDGVKHPFGYKVEDIDPIPLTAELLQELGFEQEQSYYILTLPDETTIYADAVEDEMNNWNIQVFATKLYKRGEVFIRHLHELENFIYLTIGKELVERPNNYKRKLTSQ